MLDDEEFRKRLAASNGDGGAPPRGTPEAAHWVERHLRWPELGVTLERVIVDGHEADSGVSLHTSNGRTIMLTVGELFNRTRFPATISAALTYACPSMKQDALNDIAGAILGLASVDIAFSSLDDAMTWGLAYVGSAGTVRFDDTENGDPLDRFNVLRGLRDDSADARALGSPPPNKVLERVSDGALLVVRSWFHHAVRVDFDAGSRLSAQRITGLMLRVGWQRPTSTHWKVAARRPGGGTRETASAGVYAVPAVWQSDLEAI